MECKQELILLNQGGDMRDVWNSKHYKHIRRQMDTGERVVGCEPVMTWKIWGYQVIELTISKIGWGGIQCR